MKLSLLLLLQRHIISSYKIQKRMRGAFLHECHSIFLQLEFLFSSFTHETLAGLEERGESVVYLNDTFRFYCLQKTSQNLLSFEAISWNLHNFKPNTTFQPCHHIEFTIKNPGRLFISFFQHFFLSCRSLLSILKCKALCSTWAMCFVQLFVYDLFFFFYSSWWWQETGILGMLPNFLETREHQSEFSASLMTTFFRKSLLFACVVGVADDLLGLGRNMSILRVEIGLEIYAQ